MPGGRPKGSRNKGSSKATRKLSRDLSRNVAAIGRKSGLKRRRNWAKPKEFEPRVRTASLKDNEAKLRRAPSTIHQGGEGVFAHRDFAKEELICRYLGKKITKAEQEAIEEDDKAKGIQRTYHFMKSSGNVIIDGSDPDLQTVASFVNHSCIPNCEARQMVIYRQPTVVITAIKDIRKGEELSYSYVGAARSAKRKPTPATRQVTPSACNCSRPDDESMKAQAVETPEELAETNDDQKSSRKGQKKGGKKSGRSG